MNLKSLVGEIRGTHPEARLSTTSAAVVEIAGVAYDSRQVVPGDLFLCVPGFKFDGHDFAPDAVRKGAAALLVQHPVDLDIPQIIVADVRKTAGSVASIVYGRPSRELRIIGVTGTNGKTTTTYLIKAILEGAGHKVGLIGTIQHMIGSTVLSAERTTPEAADLHRLFREMVDADCGYAVMEVSSHAVSLNRLEDVEYDVGVFTNITQDHLDFHPTFQDYLAAKTAFLASIGQTTTKPNKAIVLNADDPHVETIQGAMTVPVQTYGVRRQADVRATDVVVRPSGVQYRLACAQGLSDVHLQLTGAFNVSNSLAAFTVGLHEGVGIEVIRRTLEKVAGVPGRFERVDLGQPFSVIVDYAHTPDSLENVLRTVKGYAQGHILVVFGCGGDRDRSKRPMMGEVAANLADYVIVTSDNPRTEDPAAICRDVLEGVQRVDSVHHTTIVERRDAIEHALKSAGTNDVVVVAGKGHETYQIFRDRTIHFDDREEIENVLRGLGYRG